MAGSSRSTGHNAVCGLPAGAGERGLTGAVWLAAALVALLFAWIVVDLARRGLASLTPAFLLEAPSDAGRAGGIAPILVSTLWILGSSLALCVPLGLGSAIWLAEYSPPRSPFGRLVRISLDSLAGVPSIVFALFGNAFFVILLSMGYSILAGGLTLGCMSLPLFIRCAEEGLRSVPREYRLGGAALGLSRSSVLFRILLPRAVPGIVVGVVLAIGRTLSGTAPMMFTSGYVTRMPGSVMDSGRGLALHVFDLSMNVPGGEAHAAAAALLLMALLLALNFLAARVAERFLGGRVVPS